MYFYGEDAVQASTIIGDQLDVEDAHQNYDISAVAQSHKAYLYAHLECKALVDPW